MNRTAASPALAVPAVALACTLLLSAALAPYARAAEPLASDWAGNHPLTSTRMQAPPLADRAVFPPLDGQWLSLSANAGSERLEATMVYDAPGNRLVAFGGADAHGLHAELEAYSFATSTWSPLLATGPSPCARRWHSAVFDTRYDRMIVYGGWSDSLLSDVWALSLAANPPYWTQLVPAGPGPGARAGCGAAYDVNGDQLVIFGGVDAGSPTWGKRADVWALSLAGTPAWTPITPAGPGPSPRSGAASAFDPGGRRLYVFGGSDTTERADLWRLTLAATPAWTPVVLSGASPPARQEAGMVFDTDTGDLGISGGYDATQVFDDYWHAFFGGGSPSWYRENVPLPPRWGAAIAYDGGTATQYIHGGMTLPGNASNVLGDLWWNYPGGIGYWYTRELFPTRRLQASLVLDPVRNRMLVFGGSDGSFRNDVWERPLDSGYGWTLLACAGEPPPARRLQTTVYDPFGDRLIVFGGNDSTFLGDTWQLSLAGTPTWSPITTGSAGPGPRGGHVAIVDPVGRRMIVYGGYDGVTPPVFRLGDAWALSLTGTPAWTQLAPAGTSPSARSSASAVYDSKRGAMLLFGGSDPLVRNETWQLTLGDVPAWSRLAVYGILPGGRQEQAAAYDAKRDRMVIHGGYDQNMTLGDIFALDLGTHVWTQLYPAGIGAGARWGARAFYDPTRDGMWEFGGWIGTYSSDTWFLQWTDAPAVTPLPLVEATSTPHAAHLVWKASTALLGVIGIERSTDAAHWHAVGAALAGPDGRIAFEDRTLTPGATCAWRATVVMAGRTLRSEPAWQDVPTAVPVAAPPLAFGLRPAARADRAGVVAVTCVLPGGHGARVELLDLCGRRLDARELSSPRAGEQRVELGSGLPPGLVFVRLACDRKSATLKATVLR